MQKGIFDTSHRMNRHKLKILNNFMVETDYTNSFHVYAQYETSANVDTQTLKAIFTHNSTKVYKKYATVTFKKL